MKIIKSLFAVMLLTSSSISLAQKQAYVTADNGLTVRERPNPKARKVGKLDYGDAIEITERTNINLTLIDEGEQIDGNWVKIQSPSITGYVFNGFLSKDRIVNPIEFRYIGLSMKLKNLKTTEEFKIHTFHYTDTIKIGVTLGDSPEGKILIVNNKDYKRISVFQRFESSITIMNEGPHCDLTEWKHYHSQWKPIEAITKTKFKTLSYNQGGRQQFIDIDIRALKEEVENKCGKDWSNYVKGIKTLNDYPVGISINGIFLKVLITDQNDKVSEKIIEFKIPMGC
ncbi:SH3 domain-containing protein [Winogradskyella sp. DF17]|uniref:SH3 domain-containing protein n=1 Tax=Winogradskyella pelagia TaxID=2819984 RepID=A0ABS3SY31_9FLAO|nr:SH3 domain-containing protein [Winogradskyella sp. DF17]MBO3115401.1 SH3 domain-containing protein [Winogradskyella sp. DF17]